MRSRCKFERRFSRGLQVLNSYTLSHSLDNASADVFDSSVSTPGTVSPPTVDSGNSDYDGRHSFAAGVTYEAHLVMPTWLSSQADSNARSRS
jgi:hypothetical protein